LPRHAEESRHPRLAGRATNQQRKNFFFVNKKEAKKTSLLRARAMYVPTPAGSKVFCFVAGQAFFKKEALSFRLLIALRPSPPTVDSSTSLAF
jgi:hypothetical protein